MSQSNEDEYLVIAEYRTHPDRFAAVVQLVGELAEASRTEAGNLRYDALTVPGDRERIVIVESYLTAADFAAHRETSHFQDIAIGKVIPLLTSRVVRQYIPAQE